jgi:hypothetical protein
VYNRFAAMETSARFSRLCRTDQLLTNGYRLSRRLPPVFFLPTLFLPAFFLAIFFFAFLRIFTRASTRSSTGSRILRLVEPFARPCARSTMAS